MPKLGKIVKRLRQANTGTPAFFDALTVTGSCTGCFEQRGKHAGEIPLPGIGKGRGLRSSGEASGGGEMFGPIGEA